MGEEYRDYQFVWLHKRIIGLEWQEGGERHVIHLNYLSGSPDHFFLTPERALKGDLTISTDVHAIPVEAKPSAMTVLDRLIDIGFLDETDRYYGMVFADLHRAFLQRVSFRSNALFAVECFGADSSDGEFETMYLRICRALNGIRVRALQRVINLTATDATMQAYGTMIPYVQECFEDLARAIEDERKAIRDRRDGKRH